MTGREVGRLVPGEAIASPPCLMHELDPAFAGLVIDPVAALAPRPLGVGAGHPTGAIPTIYPRPHDIPMDRIVTGTAPHAWRPSSVSNTS